MMHGETQWVVHEKSKNSTSKTFMFTRPLYQRVEMQQSLWQNFVYNKKGTSFNGIQTIGAYQQSTPLDKVARYFLMECKNNLIVAGDNAINPPGTTFPPCARDIRAEWLNLPSNFRGNLSMSPQQKQFGVIFEYHQDLKKFFNNNLLNEYWISITLPLTGVENTLNLTQDNVHNPGTDTPRNIIESFKQPSWYYCTIDGKRTTFCLQEINVRAGKAYISDNNFLLTYYFGFSIPTGHAQDAKFMFDAVGGFNSHPGIEAGINIQLLLNRDDPDYAFCFFVNLENIFLVHDTQHRTFDLKDKPWSRYLLFNEKCGPPDQKIPGVNILTQKVRVRPYNIADFSTGWRIKSEHLELEIGYNLWGHGHEVLKLKRPFHKNHEYGIAGQGPLDPQAAIPLAASASQSTIAYQAENDETFIAIKESDLDLKSAASQSAITHTAYFALGGKKTGQKIDSFFGGGTFVEIPQKNTALGLWGLWFKWGAVF